MGAALAALSSSGSGLLSSGKGVLGAGGSLLKDFSGGNLKNFADAIGTHNDNRRNLGGIGQNLLLLGADKLTGGTLEGLAQNNAREKLGIGPLTEDESNVFEDISLQDLLFPKLDRKRLSGFQDPLFGRGSQINNPSSARNPLATEFASAIDRIAASRRR